MTKFLEKIQNLSEGQKKLILWAIVIVLGLSIFYWYFKNMKLAISGDKLQQDLKIDQLKEDLNKNTNNIEIPQF